MQIVCRYILKELPPWSEELSRYLFIWANFVGAGVALARSSHVSIDSLVARLPDSVRRKLGSVVVILVTTFSLFLLYQGVVTASAMKISFSTTMHFSMAWVFAALPAAGLIFVLYQLQTILKRKDWASTCISAIGVVVLTTILVVIGKYMSVPPGFLLLTLVCVVIILMAINTPISIAIGLACIVYLLARGNIQLLVVPITVIGGMDSFVLLAVPLFVLVGELMNTGGITQRLVTFARALVGHIRGSLGISTVLGEYIFSGISGASVADVSAMGSILIPAMKRAGYRPELAVSIVASASAMGMLVPPCIPMVVLANLTNLSVASLFIAGFLPAACMALPLIVLIYIQAVRENIPRERRQSAREVLVAFRRAILPLLTPVIILGGILGGIVTPTEAGMIGVIYALILGVFVYREIQAARSDAYLGEYGLIDRHDTSLGGNSIAPLLDFCGGKRSRFACEPDIETIEQLSAVSVDNDRRVRGVWRISRRTPGLDHFYADPFPDYEAFRRYCPAALRDYYDHFLGNRIISTSYGDRFSDCLCAG